MKFFEILIKAFTKLKKKLT